MRVIARQLTLPFSALQRIVDLAHGPYSSTPYTGRRAPYPSSRRQPPPFLRLVALRIRRRLPPGRCSISTAFIASARNLSSVDRYTSTAGATANGFLWLDGASRARSSPSGPPSADAPQQILCSRGSARRCRAPRLPCPVSCRGSGGASTRRGRRRRDTYSPPSNASARSRSDAGAAGRGEDVAPSSVGRPVRQAEQTEHGRKDVDQHDRLADARAQPPGSGGSSARGHLVVELVPMPPVAVPRTPPRGRRPAPARSGRASRSSPSARRSVRSACRVNAIAPSYWARKPFRARSPSGSADSKID